MYSTEGEGGGLGWWLTVYLEGEITQGGGSFILVSSLFFEREHDAQRQPHCGEKLVKQQ